MAAPDNDSGSASSALPAAGILAALLLLAGGLIISPAQLTTRRPAGTENVATRSAALQDIRVRLWEDPFTAIDRRRDKTNREDPPREDRTTQLAEAITQILEPKPETNVPDRTIDCGPTGQPRMPTLTVMPVMVFGDSDVEDTEGRRRSRYAIMAALGAEGFAPDEARHVGYFATPAGLRIPFEFAVEPRCRNDWVLVLWLDEGRLASRHRGADQFRPLSDLASVMDALDVCRKAGAETPEAQKRRLDRVNVKVIGPQGSETLLNMVRQASDSSDKRTVRECLSGVRMFSIATGVVRSGQLRTSHVAAKLQDVGIDFLRTTKTDGELAAALVDELRLRGVKPGHDHIALVSEWDTLYARTLTIVMRQTFCKDTQHPGECERRVHKVSYLRGLDGVVPESPSTDDVPRPRGSRRESSKSTDPPSDPEVLERPEGNGQVDYLSRLAASLRDLDTSLDAKRTALRAIGVLGSDPYDKLLVLRALREQHPNALFFTTDLDARLLSSTEYRWARNVIVAASFGLELNAALQKDVPPFRDSYQTAAFYAARVALTDSIVPDGPEPRTDGARGRRQQSPSFRYAQGKVDLLLSPRIFEIGRTRAVDLSRDRTPATCVDMTDCHDIYPPRPMFPQVRAETKWRLPLAAALGIALVSASSGRVRRGVRGFVRSTVAAYTDHPVRFWAWIALALIAAALTARAIVAAYLEWDKGEPIAFLEGVSIWPTQFIRAFAAVLP